MTSSSPIAFFDSGIGGLSVLVEAQRMLPNESFIYFADTLNVPYGSKSPTQVKAFVNEAVCELLDYDIKALVIACNTATSISAKSLRERYDFPIIGMEPAVKPAMDHIEAHQKVLVMATPLTLKQDKYQNLVESLQVNDQVIPFPFGALVEYCEALRFGREEIEHLLDQKLKAIDQSQIGVVVLGCTHFPFFKRPIQQYFGEGVQVIDGNIGTVRHLQNTLSSLDLLNSTSTHQSNITFLSSLCDTEEIQRLERAFEFLKK